MYKDNKILGLIPARGGSKGLPRKNIKSLSDKPLIAWTIEQALASKYPDNVVVSTDDKEIAEVSQKFGVEVPFLRPKEIASDTTSIIDVISHVIDFFKNRGVSFDYIALLEPTSPLRKEHDIDEAVKLLIDNEMKADSLVSIGEVHLEHPSIMKEVIKGYVMPYKKASKNIFRRQDLDKVFFPYGVIYMSKVEKLIKTKTFYQEKTIPYFIERWQNYEIDDMYDFVCVEAVLKQKKSEGGK